jgi:phosphoglycerol transferase
MPGRSLPDLLFYGSHATLSALLLAWLVPFGEWPLRVPFSYAGDGLFFSALVKTIAEEGPLHASRWGAPFGSDLVDWPLGMWLPFAISSAIYAVSGEAGTAINLLWLVSIVVAGLTATWSLTRLAVPRSLAFVVGLLYAFLPYSFLRNVSHINVQFPLVPLVALLALRVAGTRPEQMSRSERWTLLTGCLAQGLSYVYYAFFGCFLLGVGAAVGWLRMRRADLVRTAASGILLLVLGTAVPLIPSFVYWSQHGTNPDLAYKPPADADHFGLRVRHLLTPRSDHPVGALRAMASATRRADPLGANESNHVSLGLVGSLGFLGLVGLALGGVSGAFPRFDDQLGPAAALTLSALLLAQVGGLGSMFNALVAPDIRAYNRIVVYIAFFSLYAAAVLFHRGWGRVPRAIGIRRPLAGVILALLLGGGMVDQVPLETISRRRADTAPLFAEVDSFVARIESRLAPGMMVFQLPHRSIPIDHGRLVGGQLYAAGRAYLSSSSLRWSWGSMVGRTGDWQRLVARLEAADLARIVAWAGFSGIWIDRHAYDEMSQAVRLQEALAAITGARVETSSGGRYVFFDIERYRGRLESGLSAEEVAQARARARRPPFRVRWHAGCSDTDPASSWRRCGQTFSAVVRNPMKSPMRLRVNGRVRSEGPGRLQVAMRGSSRSLEVGPTVRDYHWEIDLAGGRRLILEFDFEGRCSAAGVCVEVADFIGFPSI